MPKSIKPLLLAAFLATLSGGAGASQLTYKPVNPNFGGSPFNGGTLLALAQAQNKHKEEFGDEDPVVVFTRNLQSRLLNQLSNDVVEAIFGEDPQDNGTFTVGDTSISFQRTGDAVSVSINDLLSGSSTQLELPVLHRD